MTLVFATHNENKLREVQAMMPSGIIVKSLTDIGCHEEIIEDAPTIKGNAIIKAKFVKDNYALDCFADDTGLEVDALDGEPGVFSARYAGEKKDPQANMDKLLGALKNNNSRKAHFKTVLAFAKASEVITFEGICSGEILNERQGTKGFGYDPIFKPDGYSQSFAQMDQKVKGTISHRGIAIQKFLDFLEDINLK